jgi:predicted regulator of amino acid metabolism with ACT domain
MRYERRITLNEDQMRSFVTDLYRMQQSLTQSANHMQMNGDKMMAAHDRGACTILTLVFQGLATRGVPVKEFIAEVDAIDQAARRLVGDH